MKKFCPQGHRYDEENTYYYKGGRYCKACRRRRNKDKRKIANRAEIRSYLKVRDKGLCRYCGIPAKGIDHVNPRCNKGLDDPVSNLVTACSECNGVKGSEKGFELKGSYLFFNDELIHRTVLFGANLRNAIKEQRLDRQIAQGRTDIVNFKKRKEGK